ncbi:hypothetical protein EVAR_43602_1 [Eumeta japonica]|uniref:Uncharacterized protein n=1 Tax=Eumeta variegata TaxID=151549 RepID=A0A4C1XHJ6_EUMVA|nr:hypothetical protein EVAR_43602_1 [Eumeta japonica]
MDRTRSARSTPARRAGHHSFRFRRYVRRDHLKIVTITESCSGAEESTHRMCVRRRRRRPRAGPRLSSIIGVVNGSLFESKPTQIENGTGAVGAGLDRGRGDAVIAPRPRGLSRRQKLT